MSAHTLRRSQWVDRPLEEVFAFFQNPGNLALLTPPDLGFEILTPPPIVMKAGAKIEYRIRLFGLPLRWETLIESYAPPHGFTDVQTRGPYAVWRHTHTFFREDGGTRMTDEVHYAPPLGMLGRLALPLISRELQRIFDFRKTAIERLFARRQEATP